jgi:hypothetical protein
MNIPNIMQLLQICLENSLSLQNYGLMGIDATDFSFNFQNVRTHQPNYMASQPRRPQYGYFLP